jgi:acyl carrier protein
MNNVIIDPTIVNYKTMTTTAITSKRDHVYKVIQIMVDKFGIEETQLSYKASFAGDLNIDSLDLLELITEIEKDFKIHIPDEDAERLTTVGAVIDYVDRHVGNLLGSHVNGK